MSRTFHQNFAHIVFSTKERRAMITGDMEEDLHAYLGGVIRELKGVALCIGGMPDHVHLLVRTPKTMADTDFMRTIKANSTKWARSKYPSARLFGWQDGYGWFSVSKSKVGQVSEYIDRQKEHHRKTTFREEFRVLLDRHGVECDERYAWG